MTDLDPADEAMVTVALEAALAPEFEQPIRVAAPPTPVTEATSTWVWFVALDGAPADLARPLVLRVFRPGEAEVAARDEALSAALLPHGVPLPATRWRGSLAGTHPAVLQDRLPGRPAVELLAGPQLRRVLTSLATVQAQLHAVSVDRIPLDRVDATSYLDRDLAVRRARVRAADPTGTWDWLRATAAAHDHTAPDDQVVCHGDFHPLNALVNADGAVSVVDWTDACIADRHHDVGRTTAIYWFASVVAGSRVERVALRMLRRWMVGTHQRTYERVAGRRLDPRRLSWWQTVHLYRSWLQLCELDEGAVDGPESTTTTRFPARLRAQLLDRCAVLRSAAG